MNATSLLKSRPLRVVVALAYAALLVSFIPRTPVQGPILMIALGLPLIFQLVPRNWLYGPRDWRTLRGSEETWYRQSTITGIAMVLIGIVWLIVLAVR